MSRLLELRLFLVVMVAMTIVFYLTNRVEWNENLNRAFTQAWGQLGEGWNGEEGPREDQDLNNNNREVEDDHENNRENMLMEAGVQNVWGEESFREQNQEDEICPVTESETIEDESQQIGN